MSRYCITKNESDRLFNITIGGCGCCSSSTGFPIDAFAVTDEEARTWWNGLISKEQLSEAREYLTNQLKLLKELETEFNKVSPEKLLEWTMLSNEY